MVTPRRSSPTPMLAPTLGTGVTATAASRLTAAGVDVLELGVGEGLNEGELLPVAVALGEGSEVGPCDGGAAVGGSPAVGAIPTRTTCGVGAPCAPTAPGVEGDGELDADGTGLDGTTVMVMAGTGGAATGSSGTNSITSPSRANPAAPTIDR